MCSVVIDKNQCDSIIEFLENINLPPDKEELMNIELEKDVLKNLYFTIVAICHQTTPIMGPQLNGIINGEKLFGWDYMRVKWLIATTKNNSIVYPPYLSSISSKDIINILRDDKGNSTIFKPEVRALMLNNIGKRMIKLKYTSVQNIYDKGQGFLIRKDGNGLLNQLSKFKAYSDPVKKKSLLFLTLMKNHSLWHYKDNNNLGPSIDYHEIRGHLRYGSVKINDSNLIGKIYKNIVITQEEDVDIRKAIYEAIIYISKRSGISPGTLHYFFWNLFRNCCNREKAHCKNCPTSCTLPQRYKNLKQHVNVKGCLLENKCISSNLKNKLFEPKVITEYY